MTCVVLLAKKGLGDFDPTAIPPETSLEEWLTDHFELRGPMTEDDASEMTEVLGADDPNRYWAILPIKDAQIALS
jgi:hypothetical protein